MCGITGWFNLQLRPEERLPLLRRMCLTIGHRGPDDQGVFLNDFTGLGFQRLSILDLEGGHQPMGSEDGAIQIVFNGEIFNHAELRDDLMHSGCHFRTSSDTEVLLKLYEQFGLRAFERMNGMFAVAIWDSRKGLFHLVRDRLGVKPLYYAMVGDALIFGSEIKAVLASGQTEKAMNERALWDYLTFRYVPGPETIWKGIMKLSPAHSLTLRVGKREPEISRWWRMPMQTPVAEKSDAEYEAEFQALFEDAVGLRMRADVPVGITLSGGLDSSAVVAAARLTKGDLKTFSVAFSDSPETNELPYAREVARQFGTDHHEITIGQKEFMEFLPDFVWYTDEPLADLASVPLYYVSHLARDHVKVVLSGEGSDEILAGYSFEQWAKRCDDVAGAKAAMPWWNKGMAGKFAARLSPDFAQRRELAAAICDQRRVPEPISMTNYWSSADKRRLLAGRHDWPDSMDKIRSQLSEAGEQHPLNQALYVYCQDWLVEDLLMKADRMSMANSLELRTPFLDYRLVEWAARLPPRLKAGRTGSGGYHTKEILRRYAATRLPDSIVNRPKQGFPVPVYGWLSGALASWARDILLAPQARLRKWFNPVALNEVLSAGTSATGSMLDKHRLWNLLILEVWMQKWMP